MLHVKYMRTNLSEQSLGCIRLCYLQRIWKKKLNGNHSSFLSSFWTETTNSNAGTGLVQINIPVDCIYPWTHDFIWRQTSAFQSFPTLMSQKYAPNLRKFLHWHIENRKSIEDFLREVDEDSVSIKNGEFQSNDVVGTFGKAFKVCGAFTGRCSRRYFANSRKNNFQIEKEHFVDKHTNPWVPSF